MKEIISTSKAPSAIGPYSQAVKANGFLYISGQIPIDPETANFAGDDIKTQTNQCFMNIKAILETAGLNFQDVIKMNVYLSDMNNFAAMNEVYATFFDSDFPARAAVEVSRLPKDALVEIETIAVYQ